MRRTKIVATIGPASRDPEVLVRMVEAGMDVARLNFSHGSAEEHAEVAERVREAAGRAGPPVAILQDLPGPKLRIGKLRDDVVELGAGDPLTFACGGGDGGGDDRRMWISWAGLADAVEPGRGPVPRRRRGAPARDGVRPADGEVDTVVEIGGAVASRQGLNIPGPTATAAGGARGGPRAPAHRREDRRRPRRAEVRAPRRGRHFVREHTRSR